VRPRNAPTNESSAKQIDFSSLSQVGVSLSAVPQRRPRSRREVNQVQKLFTSLQRREEGQTMAEYGVVLAVITALVFAALTLLSDNIIAALNRVAGVVGLAG
jgi:Flp pilus assembly pilin Flp